MESRTPIEVRPSAVSFEVVKDIITLGLSARLRKRGGYQCADSGRGMGRGSFGGERCSPDVFAAHCTYDGHVLVRSASLDRLIVSIVQLESRANASQNSVERTAQERLQSFFAWQASICAVLWGYDKFRCRAVVAKMSRFAGLP